jgi:hypothetical protein
MRYLTAKDVESGHMSLAARVNEVEYTNGLRDLCIAACQALADSPCPVCCGDYNDDGLWHQIDGGYADGPCHSCGDFPEDRLGHAFRDWQHACDALERKS